MERVKQTMRGKDFIDGDSDDKGEAGDKEGVKVDGVDDEEGVDDKEVVDVDDGDDEGDNKSVDVDDGDADENHIVDDGKNTSGDAVKTDFGGDERTDDDDETGIDFFIWRFLAGNQLYDS